MLERHTILPTWDDHEIANDRYWDYDDARYYGDDGFELNDDEQALMRFFMDGILAYHAWLPVRARLDLDAEHPFDRWWLHRSVSYGDLADLAFLDERWYRSQQPPEAGREAPSGAREQSDLSDEEREAQDRTMLGDEQRAWLEDFLADSSAVWTTIANPVQFSPAGFMLPRSSIYVNLDAWDGYEAERRRVTDALANVDNALVLAGDLHTYLVGYVQRRYGSGAGGPDNRVGVELMTPGVTSGNLIEMLEAEGYRRQPGDDETMETAVLAANPHLEHFNSSRHGYAKVTLTREEAVYEGYVVDKSTRRVDGNRQLLTKFRVPEGEVEIEEIDRNSPTAEPAAAGPSAVTDADPRRTQRPALGPDQARAEAQSLGEVRELLAGQDQPLVTRER
jgi:alkaline phosphatase D